MTTVRRFYDSLAESYHLIFDDWNRSIARQSAVLDHVLREQRDLGGCRVLDAATGIGTQALGLAARGYRVVGTDVSSRALARARREAADRGLTLSLATADFRCLPFRDGTTDAVIACDNALPHLLSLSGIRAALGELRRVARAGGVCVISMRDYPSTPPAGTVERRPYGERVWNDRRYFAEQEWRWNGATYQLLLRIVPIDDIGERIEVETTYLALPIHAMLDLMREAGFIDVQRLDDVFYQPLLLGTVPGAS